MAVGLTKPTEGGVTVLGGVPAGLLDALEGIAFVAQDAPLYRNLLVADMLLVARRLNRCWDQRRADDRLERLGIPPRGRRSASSPAGRRRSSRSPSRWPGGRACWCSTSRWPRSTRWRGDDFMASVAEAAREDHLCVVLSSHVLAELERVATYLIVLTRGQVQEDGGVKDLLASHGAGLEEIALRHLRAGVPHRRQERTQPDEHRNHHRRTGDGRRPAPGAVGGASAG